MNKNSPHRWWLVAGLALLLASCQLQGTGPTQDSPASSYADPTDGEPIPLALAESLALGLKVSTGGITPQQAKGYGFASETVYDMSGKPLHHLILVGPERRENFWAVLEKPDPEHALYAVGATDKRSFFSFIIPASGFKSIVETRDRAGSFKRFLSPTPGTLYLEDRRRRIWDTATATPVDPKEVERWKKAQRDLFEERHQTGVLDKIKEDWDKLRQQAYAQGLTPQGAGLPSLSQLTRPDGHLDMEGLMNALEAQATARGISPAYVNERSWCMGWFCAGMGYANVVRNRAAYPDISNNTVYNPDNPEACTNSANCAIAWGILNADPLGNQQELNKYQTLPAGGEWGASEFGPPLPYSGCGPMSAVRLFAWYTTERRKYGHPWNFNLVSRSSWPSDAEQVAKIMFEPVRLGISNYYQPRIGRYMNTQHFMGEGLTFPGPFLDGANTWLQNHAALGQRTTDGQEIIRWEMRGDHRVAANWINYLGIGGGLLVHPGLLAVVAVNAWDFAQYTWKARDIVRGKIGRDNEPVIALYTIGSGPLAFAAHYAMSSAYIVHEGWFSANVLLWMLTGKGDVDGSGRYINVTDMGALANGVYGVYPVTRR